MKKNEENKKKIIKHSVQFSMCSKKIKLNYDGNKFLNKKKNTLN